ncbi:glycosyltransferase [Sporolactobacillus sp. CPB3-1]|uniref:Glycosyltransferase n=1 Tax=Sporolactobacillus mangiferae TaxID=2940498 RepID=A0ABT0M9A3_9BACL|nr:glycosyltransferase [Sporolactobacillus mangiferae]MCL1631168.1 glycosyltransferase [Sporolactobacillus mangiferae]
MDRFPLVSVILPVYNVEKYLNVCLDSLLNQTYKNLEIIAVNDGSTDKSKEILESYIGRLRKFKIINQKNSGLSMARNAALSYITGKYLYFLDSDDYLLSNTFENLVTSAENYNLDLIRFNANVILDSDLSENYFAVGGNYDDNGILISNKIYGINEFVHLNTNRKIFRPAVWLYFYKSKVIIDNHIKFWPQIKHEDELFTPMVLKYCNRIAYDPNKYFQRRLRPNSIMTSDINADFMSFVSKKVIIEILNSERENNKIFNKFIIFRLSVIYESMLNYKVMYKKNLLQSIDELSMLKKFFIRLKYVVKKQIKKLLKKMKGKKYEIKNNL